MVAAFRRLPAHLAGLWHGDRRALLHEALLAFLALGFLIAPEPAWADLFYVLLLPLALHVAWMRRASFRWSDVPAHVAIGSGLVLLFALSLIWDESAHAAPVSLWLWFWDALCTMVFVLSLADALASSAAYRTRLVNWIIAAATLNAVISVARFVLFAESWGSDPTRLGGWAEMRHPILGAIIMGMVVLLATGRALATGKWRYAVVAGIGLLFIALTGSRGPALAIMTAMALLLGASRPRLFLLAVTTAALATGALALVEHAALARIVTTMLNRGDSHRFIIWQLSWHDILRRPLLGHGPTYRIDRPDEAFPHNLFLSTWLYTGIVGLTLLLAYLAAVLRQALKAPPGLDRILRLAILLHLLICAMTDFSQVVKGPGPMWYMLWLGTLFCAANQNLPIAEQN